MEEKMGFNDSNKEIQNNQCNYNDCCQCKKIFMILVILILTFMSGIMVGNCGRCRYSDYYYNYPYFAKKHHIKPQKMHRGMHSIPTNATPNTPQGNQLEGFIIEIDQNN